MSDTLGELMDIFMSQSQNTPRSTHRHGSRHGECKVVRRFKPTYDSTQVTLRDNLGKSRYHSVSEMPIYRRPQVTGVPTASKRLNYYTLMTIAATVKYADGMTKHDAKAALLERLNDGLQLNMDMATLDTMMQIIMDAHTKASTRQ